MELTHQFHTLITSLRCDLEAPIERSLLFQCPQHDGEFCSTRLVRGKSGERRECPGGCCARNEFSKLATIHNEYAPWSSMVRDRKAVLRFPKAWVRAAARFRIFSQLPHVDSRSPPSPHQGRSCREREALAPRNS